MVTGHHGSARRRAQRSGGPVLGLLADAGATVGVRYLSPVVLVAVAAAPSCSTDRARSGVWWLFFEDAIYIRWLDAKGMGVQRHRWIC